LAVMGGAILADAPGDPADERAIREAVRARESA